MSDEQHTPSIANLRDAYVFASEGYDGRVEERRLRAEFDRAIAAHDAEVRGEAYHEGYEKGREDGWDAAHEPTVTLPTEPGFYLAPYEPAECYELRVNGTWWREGEQTSPGQVLHDCGSGLARLVPEGSERRAALEEALGRVSEWLADWAHDPGLRVAFERDVQQFGLNEKESE